MREEHESMDTQTAPRPLSGLKEGQRVEITQVWRGTVRADEGAFAYLVTDDGVECRFFGSSHCRTTVKVVKPPLPTGIGSVVRDRKWTDPGDGRYALGRVGWRSLNTGHVYPPDVIEGLDCTVEYDAGEK